MSLSIIPSAFPGRRPTARPAPLGRPPRPSLTPLAPLTPERLESRRLLSTADGYSLSALATISGSQDAAPGGGSFVNDFEPYGLTDNGLAAFAADVSTGGEGVFLATRDDLRQVIRAGQPAPGGGTFGGFGVFGPLDVNVHGDVAFGFGLEPFQQPLGVNAGVYLYRQKPGSPGQVTQPGEVVMRPGNKAPGGGTFAGAGFHASVNDFRDVAFVGTVRGADIDPTGGPGVDGLGVGVFLRDRHGRLSKVVRPGDKAPGGGVFDFAQAPSINNRGDVAFGGHVAGEKVYDFGTPQSEAIFAGESVYLKRAGGGIVSIAHQGQAAPGGGKYRVAFGPVVNNHGDVVFIGDLMPQNSNAFGTSEGVFLYSGGKVKAIARPGDALPGGGHLVTAAFNPSNYDLNDAGQVVFNARLDTRHTEAGKQVDDYGVYLWSKGKLRLVARSGTAVPGAGTISQTNPIAALDAPTPHGGTIINNRGQILFQALTSGGSGERGLQDVLIRADVAPAVLPPHATVAGKTLAQWSAAWWQYVFSVPKAHSPVLDLTGADAGVNQSGSSRPVFFLSGSFSLLPGPSEIQRSVTVRPDQYLFFPVVNDWVDNLGVNPPLTVPQLRAAAAQGVDGVTELHASIDGVAIPDSELRRHREVSPVFSYTLPKHGLLEGFGFDDQTVSPAVADGYYLMLPPLAPGSHTIRFGGSQAGDAGSPGFSLDVTYRLNVR